MKIRLVAVKLFRGNRGENGRTDRYDQANSRFFFRNFTNAPQIEFIIIAWCCQKMKEG